MVSEFVRPAERRLPVWAVVKRSYGYLWDHRLPFLIPVFMLFLAIFASSILINLTQMGSQPSADLWTASRGAEVFVGAIGKFAISLAFAVGVHRSVLLSENRNGVDFFRWDRNFRRYFVTSIAIFFISLGYMIAMTMLIVVFGVVMGLCAKIPFLGIVVGLAAIIGLVAGPVALTGQFMRVFIALPAAALGSDHPIALSWDASRGNGLRLLAATFLSSVPVVVVSLIVLAPQMIVTFAAMSEHEKLPPPGLLTIGASALVTALAAPVLVSVFSLSYDVLVRGGGPQAGQA